MRVLITGGCGFLGSNIAKAAAGKGWTVSVLDNMSRVGSHVNRSWLESDGLVNVIEADIREPEQVTDIVHDLQPEIIFHLAGQVAMTTSIANPRLDFSEYFRHV